MKIAFVKQGTSYESPCNSNIYAVKLIRILKETGADIIVGPELAISNGLIPISENGLKLFVDNLKEYIPNGNLIIPGTAIVFDNIKKSLRNIAPAITKGKTIFLQKKSASDEERVAKRLGLEYETGNDNEGVFDYNNNNIALEICRDHGMGKLKNSLDKQVDFQFVLACGLPGISPCNCIVKDKGVVGFVNGMNNNLKPEVYALRKNGDSYKIIKGEEKEDYLLIDI